MEQHLGHAGGRLRAARREPGEGKCMRAERARKAGKEDMNSTDLACGWVRIAQRALDGGQQLGQVIGDLVPRRVLQHLFQAVAHALRTQKRVVGSLASELCGRHNPHDDKKKHGAKKAPPAQLARGCPHRRHAGRKEPRP